MKKILFTLVTMLLPVVAWAAMTQVPVPTAISGGCTIEVHGRQADVLHHPEISRCSDNSQR